ncbi:hypothetical protein BD626DRAFT_191389 [Schizophyllum amplum]|uniref:Uncharacterized protein n=1 Tax=Schizophyllum amplum TaxID=97359 RepID=A0A550CLV1_9AGAR|nr:hypothetical protein BD626DRAFT_191389 [Auriculariopsis ampla]
MDGRFDLLGSIEVSSECEPVSSLSTPLSTTPSNLTENIWSRVLWHATRYDASQSMPPSDKTRCSYLLVNKAFYQAGLAISYENLCICTVTAARKLDTHLYAYPERTDFIKTLTVGQDDNSFFSDSPPLEDILKPVLRHVRNLQSLRTRQYSETGISWSTFTLLAEGSGPSLRDLDRFPIKDAGALLVPAPLGLFACLHTLIWDSLATFDDQAVQAHLSMPALETIDIARLDLSFVRVLAKMRCGYLSTPASLALTVDAQFGSVKEGHSPRPRGATARRGEARNDACRRIWHS